MINSKTDENSKSISNLIARLKNLYRLQSDIDENTYHAKYYTQ